jgi:hypothetical protein
MEALFSKKGEFIPLAQDVIEALPEDRRGFYNELAEAVDTLNAVVVERDDAADTVERWVGQRNAAQEELRKRPKKTQHDLIQELKGRA